MRKTLMLGIALFTLALAGCAGGGSFGCDGYSCSGGAGANVGPIGGSFGGGVDRYGAGAHAGVHVGGARLSTDGDDD